MKIYEKIITINPHVNINVARDLMRDSMLRLFYFMYEKSPYVEYFEIKLKDSEKTLNAKDMVLRWADDEDEKL
jgi:hypothetical protein